MVTRCAALVAALLLVACGNDADSGGTGGGGAAGDRPRSTATLRIVEPAIGAIVASPLTVRLELEGGKIIEKATQNLKPDEGHIHVLMDGKLQSMNYELTQELTAPVGRHVLQAEFVAGDHAPFEPRVVATTTFEVT